MRTRLIPLLLLIAVLDSCKKDHFNPEEIRLLKTEMVDSAGGVHHRIFEFDQAGRITKVSGATDNGTPSVISTITYSGNVVTFSDDPVTIGLAYTNSTLMYQLNNDHQPILRVVYDTLSISPPENPQRTIKRDTTRYEYDADGLLIRVTGTIYDSTWFNPGVVQTTTGRRTYTRDYTNTNGKLTSITTHMLEMYTFRQLPYQSVSSYTKDATHTFEYIRNEPHKTDFVNAWLLAELRILYTPEYPLNKSYSHFPEKVTYSEVTKNATNGQITDTYSYSRTVTLDHNKYGFISSITPIGRPYDQVALIYNR